MNHEMEDLKKIGDFEASQIQEVQESESGELMPMTAGNLEKLA